MTFKLRRFGGLKNVTLPHLTLDVERINLISDIATIYYDNASSCPVGDTR
jgi:hypothetical protein